MDLKYLPATSMDPAQVLEAALIARHRIVNETISRGDSPVQKFYDGAVVLVTGATGFLGKQLIEKLFRSCKIQKIFILLRPKIQKSFQERINEMVKDKLYEYLHRAQPDFVTKVIPVEGDITKIRLGMSEESWNTLTSEVDVIFHGAATINFVEPLTVAILTNVRGTREMLTLAKTCKKLKSFVHISTAFAHATPERSQQPILEEFYECPLFPFFAIDLVEQVDTKTIDAITPQLIGNWSNTYSFTKALSEDLIRRMAGDLPICIVRPAIVMPACRELPGWVDKTTMNGPVGFITGACLGGLHVMYANTDTILDMVPVDMVNNAVIAAAHETFRRRQRGATEVKIYTVTSQRKATPISAVYEFLDSKLARSLITPKLVWYGYLVITESTCLFFLLTWLLHFIPGYIVDLLLKLTGNKPKAIRLFNKAYKQNKVYGVYMTNYWKFGDTNLLEMFENLSSEDRIIFNCDTATIDVDQYMPTCCIGVRKYILRDKLQNTKYAVRKAYWLRIANAIYLSIYAYVIWSILKLFYVFTRTIFGF